MELKEKKPQKKIKGYRKSLYENPQLKGICQGIFPDISLISILFSLIQYSSWANIMHYAYLW